MKIIILLTYLTLITIPVFAELNVVTTTTVIYDLVKQVGKEKVKAEYLCRGDQDPHFLEILPSYMLKLRKADLVFKIGLDLEKWLPQLIDGSRNNTLKLVDLSLGINKKEVPAGKIDARMGDVHPYGNPHYWLDPGNVRIMASTIYEALAEIDSKNEEYYKKNLASYLQVLDKKIGEWETLMEKLKGKPVVFFHSSWVYFTDRYGIKTAAFVEPKPGVPPAPSHNAEVIAIIKKSNVRIIMMENYYSDSAPNQIAKITGVSVVKVPIAVFGIKNVNSYIELMDYIVNQVSKAA